MPIARISTTSFASDKYATEPVKLLACSDFFRRQSDRWLAGYNVFEYGYPDPNTDSSTRDAPASTQKRETSPDTPAFAPDAVYSPMGDFYGNFPGTPGAAAASPMSFNPTGNGVGPRGAGFNASAPGFSQLMSAGQFPASNPFLLAAGKPPTPFNGYGYRTQPQPTAGQIGGGNGISPFSAGPAGINPDEPALPTWPSQPDGPARYLTSRVVRTPETPGDKPVRSLGRRTDSPSQGSESDSGAPAAVSPMPSHGPLSIYDAYLEYRRRLDANQSQASTMNAGEPAATAASDDS
jgi:hypothetical protein